MTLSGRKVLVVGMEKSGQASVAFLRERDAIVTATDARPHEIPNVPFVLQDRAPFLESDLIVISPGVPMDIEPLNAARARGIPVIGEVELAAPFLLGKTVGITGSNGKTTTTAMVGHILEEANIPVQVGGNIGTPVTAMVATSRQDKWNVLELSSFQLETIRTFRADIAVALNVTQNHLDRHRTFEVYASAKGNLFRTQRATDCAVLNANDPTCRSFATLTPANKFWFGPDMLKDGIVYVGENALMPAAEIPIRGAHNIENTMAAATAAHLTGVGMKEIAAAVRTFQAVEHRLEFVRNLSGIDFYNDSKATSVDATSKALSSFPAQGTAGSPSACRIAAGPSPATPKLWLILGGKDKGSDYTVLTPLLKSNVHAVLLIGAAAPIIRTQLETAIPLIDSQTLASAVAEAYRRAQPGDTVLLAPACASFDQFQSYEHRGRAFKDLVRALPPK